MERLPGARHLHLKTCTLTCIQFFEAGKRVHVRCNLRDMERLPSARHLHLKTCTLTCIQFFAYSLINGLTSRHSVPLMAKWIESRKKLHCMSTSYCIRVRSTALQVLRPAESQVQVWERLTVDSPLVDTSASARMGPHLLRFEILHPNSAPFFPAIRNKPGWREESENS